MKSLRTATLAAAVVLMMLSRQTVRADDAAPGAAAPVAEKPVPGALESPDQMEDGALNDLYGRLGMSADDFAAAKPAAKGTAKDPKDGKGPKEEKGFAETPEEKVAREEEERVAAEAAAAAGDGKTPEELAAEGAETKRLEDEAAAAGVPVELLQLGLADEQMAAVKEILAKGAKPEELAKAKTDLEAAQTEVARLTELTKERRPVAIAKMHPTFMLGDLNAVAQRERELSNFEAWAVEHWDGADAQEARGDVPATPAFTAAQIRAQYTKAKQEREGMIPKVREHLKWRETFDNTEVKAAYPELLNPKSPEYVVMQNILGEMPGIGAKLPNIKMIIGDALRGEKVRMAEAAAKVKTGATAAKAGTVAGAKVAPRLPTTAAPARASAAARPKKSNVPDEAMFVKRGGNRDALVAMFQEMEG